MASSTAYDGLADLPTPAMITLLFKCHKSTTVLSVLPTTSFGEIKALLLAALAARNIPTLPNSTTPLPTNPDDLEFGVLANRKDPTKGWVPMEINEQESMGSKTGLKKKIGGRNGALNENPLGAGLTDGSWVAYRVKKPKTDSETPSANADVGTPDIEIDEDPGWDVVLPTFEDDDAE